MVHWALPADHRIDPDREGLFRGVLRAAAGGLARGAFGVESPLYAAVRWLTTPKIQARFLMNVFRKRDVFGPLGL